MSSVRPGRLISKFRKTTDDSGTPDVERRRFLKQHPEEEGNVDAFVGIYESCPSAELKGAVASVEQAYDHIRRGDCERCLRHFEKHLQAVEFYCRPA